MNNPDPIKVRSVQTGKFGMGSTTPTAKTHSLSATNWTTIATIDCNNSSNDQLSDMVGFIITVLLQYGMINGSVTA